MSRGLAKLSLTGLCTLTALASPGLYQLTLKLSQAAQDGQHEAPMRWAARSAIFLRAGW
jgi:hypothetical protein